MKTTVLSAAVLMLFAAGAARAEEGARPCKADIEKFCKDVKPGEGRIIACLKAHEAELSTDCKAKDMEMKGRGEARGGGAMGEPCKADMEKFCKDSKPGERMGCMKEHEKDLSAACKARIAEGKQEAAGQHPCAAEMQKFCAGIKPGDGKLADCVKEHEKDFSDTCKANFAKHKKEIDKNNPCAADMEKFCKDVKPGKGGKIACMKAHEAELSDACKARHSDGKERMGKSGEGRRGGMKSEPGPGGVTGTAGGAMPQPPAGSAGN